jgi:hypothetical protein
MKKRKLKKLTELIYSSVNNHLKGYGSKGRKLQTYVEIGDDYLKLLQIKDENLVYNQSYINPSQKISFYLAKAEYDSQDLVLVIPSSKLFIEVLELPSVSKEKLRSILKFKFLDKLPSKEEEVYFSYYIIKESNKGSKVLAFAVLKEFLNPIYYSCYEEGINISRIIPASLIYHFYHQDNLGDYDRVLYVDKGIDYYNFIFFSENDYYIRASRSVDLKEEVAKTNSYLERRYQLSKAPLVVVNGTKVDDYSDLNKENYRMNDDIWFYAADALEEIKGDCLMQYFYDKKQEYIIINSIILIIIIVINLLSFGVNWKLDSDKLATLQTKIAKLSPVISQIDHIKGEYSKVNQEINDLKDNINLTYSYLPWLEELSKILPEGTKVDQIHFKDYQLNLLAGTAPSAIGVMNRLEESGYFTNLEFIGNIISEQDGERFKIVGELVNEIE